MKSFCRHSGSCGFSLIELLMTIGIMMLFTIAFYGAFCGMYTEISNIKAYCVINTSASNVIDRVVKDSKEALAVVPSYNYGGSSYTTNNTTLILKLPSIYTSGSSSGQPTNISTSFDYVIYRINPSNRAQLLRTLDVGSGQREGGRDISNFVVANNIRSILFSRDGTGLSSIASGTISAMKYFTVSVTTFIVDVTSTKTSELSTDVNLMTGTLS